MLNFLSDVHRWRQTKHPLYDTVCQVLSSMDDYLCEHFHSVLRSFINRTDTAPVIISKAYAIEQYKAQIGSILGALGLAEQRRRYSNERRDEAVCRIANLLGRLDQEHAELR
jgi:hypothetical protein